MPITTPESVKAHMGIKNNDLDSVLVTWIAQCEVAIARKIKRQISQVELTEFYSGTGTNTLWLRGTPVQSITSLSIDDAGYAGQGPGGYTEVMQAGTDYALFVDQPTGSGIASMSGRVWKINGTWPRPQASIGALNSVPGDGMGNIKITYVAGWPADSMPPDLVLAVTQMVVQIKSTRGDGVPLQSEGMDYYNYTRVNPADLAKMLGSVESLIAPFKRLVV